MRLFYFCLVAFIAYACAPEKGWIKKRVAKKNVSIFTKKDKSPHILNRPKLLHNVSKTVPSLSPSYSPFKKLFPPSILTLKDNVEMVLINLEGYRATSSEPNIKTVGLPEFYIDRYETTVAQFKLFRSDYSEVPFTENKDCPHCPAMAIDWESANQYCQWAGKRLPSEAEWEAAARGLKKSNWPWGNQFFENYANILGNTDGFNGPAPVGSFPAGTSPFGAKDMIGNVWEWVNDEVASFTENKSVRSLKRIAKGGGWRSQKYEAAIDFQNIALPDIKSPTFGFRCSKFTQ